MWPPSRYRCDGAGLACNAQEDAESDPSYISTQVHRRVIKPEQ